MLRVLAVDLGASSVRIASVDLDATPPALRVVHRYPHVPVATESGLRWEWRAIVREVIHGLETALEGGPAASIGVDAWGVDYGLLDAGGQLLSAPYCYRDARADGWRDVAERIGPERLYRTTGVQLMRINTIFQLAAHDRRELSLARTLLLMPELLAYELTGVPAGERTSAGTTALVDLATGVWSRDLLAAIDVDRAIMPGISRATSLAGSWRGVPVHLVGGHDTASAVAALPSPKPNAAFISSGTWMLVGSERAAPDLSEAAMRANFSNEAGVFGNVRFLKNVTGLWMLEQCRTQWGDPPLDALLSAAGALPGGGPILDAMEARFLAPADMEAEVRAAARLPTSAGRDAVVRCILDSLAAAASAVVHDIESLTGTVVPEIVVVGGGAQNALLNRLIEAAAEIGVRAGPSEATLLGNALVQGIALGRFSALDEARAALDRERH